VRQRTNGANRRTNATSPRAAASGVGNGRNKTLGMTRSARLTVRRDSGELPGHQANSATVAAKATTQRRPCQLWELYPPAAARYLHAMSEADLSGPASAAAAGGPFVEHDLPCLACGYNLRGLALAGLCPECAAPVTRSRAGNLLKNREPGWVGRVALGLRLVAVAFTICVSLLVVGLLMLRVGMIMSGRGDG